MDKVTCNIKQLKNLSCRCQHCEKTFVFKNSLKKHLEKGRCAVLKQHLNVPRRSQSQLQQQQHEHEQQQQQLLDDQDPLEAQLRALHDQGSGLSPQGSLINVESGLPTKQQPQQPQLPPQQPSLVLVRPDDAARLDADQLPPGMVVVQPQQQRQEEENDLLEGLERALEREPQRTEIGGRGGAFGGGGDCSAQVVF